MKYKILGFSSGEVNDIRSWSGINYHFYTALKKQCDVVGIINSAQRIPAFEEKMLSKNYKPDFVIKYQKERAAICRRKIQQIKKAYDLILQFGMSPIVKHQSPFVIYLDRTHKEWFRKYGSAPFLDLPGEKDQPYKMEYIKIETAMYKAAAKLFTFSYYARKSLIEDYGIDPQNVITVGAGPNMPHIPNIDKNFDGKTILFVGTDAVRKGADTLLEAFRKVRKEIPDARLFMVSSGLIKYCDRINVKRAGITIKGFSGKQLLDRLYRMASVFVMPSLYEDFGIVFLEAMAYKLPCIGTNVCAMPEIIEDNKTGFLVRPRDYRELADRIISLLIQKNIAKAMGERGRQKVIDYYNWDDTVKRILKGIGDINLK